MTAMFRSTVTANLLRLLLLPLALTLHTHGPEGDQRSSGCEICGISLRGAQAQAPLSLCLRTPVALRLCGGGAGIGGGMAAADAAHLARVNQDIRYAFSSFWLVPSQACVVCAVTQPCCPGAGSMEIADMAIRRRRFISEETQVLDYFKPKDAALTRPKPKANRRGSGRMTEREEVPLSPFRMSPPPSPLREPPSYHLSHALSSVPRRHRMSGAGRAPTTKTWQ